MAGLLALLILLTAADFWYWKTGELTEHLSTAAKRNLPYDISYIPTTNRGQAAADYWLRAARRLPGGDDEGN